MDLKHYLLKHLNYLLLPTLGYYQYVTSKP
nr:MAG TPA: hypothetical protein [Bacteriophage sp.]